MEQLHPGFRFERLPQLGGRRRERDVPRVGVAQPEDPRRAVRTAARVADRLALEHEHVAAAAQRVRGRESEQPAADDHDVGADPVHRGILGR